MKKIVMFWVLLVLTGVSSGCTTRQWVAWADCVFDTSTSGGMCESNGKWGSNKEAKLERDRQAQAQATEEREREKNEAARLVAERKELEAKQAQAQVKAMKKCEEHAATTGLNSCARELEVAAFEEFVFSSCGSNSLGALEAKGASEMLAIKYPGWTVQCANGLGKYVQNGVEYQFAYWHVNKVVDAVNGDGLLRTFYYKNGKLTNFRCSDDMGNFIGVVVSGGVPTINDAKLPVAGVAGEVAITPNQLVKSLNDAFKVSGIQLENYVVNLLLHAEAREEFEKQAIKLLNVEKQAAAQKPVGAKKR